MQVKFKPYLKMDTVPKGSISCLMCKASIQFNRDQKVHHEYNRHLEDHHGVIFHHEVFLSINLLSFEFLGKIIEEFHKSGDFSSCIPRPNKFGEEVINIEVDSDRPDEKTTKVEKDTSVLNKCETCNLEYYLLKDMIKCVNKHKMDETKNQLKILKEEKRLSKSKALKRTSAMMTEEIPVKKSKMSGDKPGANRLDDDMMAPIDNAITEKSEPKKANPTPKKLAARPPTPMKPSLVSDSPKTILSCDQCSFTTFKNIALKKHKKQEHSHEKVYPCHLCEKYFVTESNRDDHVCDVFAKRNEEMGTALAEALNSSDKPQDQKAIVPNLEETVVQKENQESSKSDENLAKPRSFDEIFKISEYFSAFPKQCRRGYESDKLKYKLVDADVFPEGWFYRTVGSRGDREFLSPDYVIFRSKKAAGEYMKCMGIYSSEVLQKFGL